MTSSKTFLAAAALTALVLSAGPLGAALPAAAPGAKDAARVTAGTYKADPHHTLVGWGVNHLGITPYFGIFGDVNGSLTLDPKNIPAAKLDVTIPVSKVTTASAGLTEHLFKAPAKAGDKPDFFGPSPADARFVSTSVVPGSNVGEATVTGNLTLNGVTKPVTLEVEFYGAGKMPAEMGGGEQIGFEAESTIRRSDFGLAGFIPLVSDEVELHIVAAFAK